MYPESSATSGADLTRAQFIDQVSSAALLYHPGTVWDYSLSIDVLGLVVEQISEQSLGKYLQENVWKPLGMTDTQFFISADKASRYAKALPIDPEGRPQSVRPVLTQPLKLITYVFARCSCARVNTATRAGPEERDLRVSACGSAWGQT
jgi:CubicO group peptidase (beta-lactamase class C family)